MAAGIVGDPIALGSKIFATPSPENFCQNIADASSVPFVKTLKFVLTSLPACDGVDLPMGGVPHVW